MENTRSLEGEALMRCFHDKQGPEGALTGGNMDLQWRTPGVLKERLS
jgi:hypothetical protein